LTEVLCQREEDKKLTMAEEGRAAPSNSEMIVSLSGMSGSVFINCSKLVVVLSIWRHCMLLGRAETDGGLVSFAVGV
jgi:hypothetical protein